MSPAPAAARLTRRAARAGVRSAKRPVRRLWRRQVLRRGIDDTDGSARRSALVVAPHPDDETIGCGAAIARKRAAGTDVEVVVVCDGRHSHHSDVIPPRRLAELRGQESIDACELLGVDGAHVRLLGFEELTLWRCLDDVAAALAAVIDDVRPDEILVVTDQDWHTDHQATHVALLRAAHRSGYQGTVGAYPVWFWSDGPWRHVPILPLGAVWRDLARDVLAARRLPAARLVRTDGYAGVKRAAFSRYRSQLESLSGEPGWATFPPGWIDPFCSPAEVFFPVEPSALGAALLRPVPASAPGVEPPPVDALRRRLGPPALADRFDSGTLAGRSVGVGAARWKVDAGAVECGAGGALPGEGGATALLTLDRPARAVQLVIDTGPIFADVGVVGLRWRGTPPQSCAGPLGPNRRRIDPSGSPGESPDDGGPAAGGWRVMVDADRAELACSDGSTWQVRATSRVRVEAARRHVLSVEDEGGRFLVRLDDRPLFDGAVTDDCHAGGTAVGFVAGPGRRFRVRTFEAWIDAAPADAT